MECATVFLIQLTQYQPDRSIAETLGRRYRVRAVNDRACIESGLGNERPFVACFDFDYPDAERLAALTETKRRFPSVPVVMITEQHSEALAVWALRSRVWDYFVRPVEPAALLGSVDAIYRLKQNTARERTVHLPPQPLPMEARFHGARGHDRLTDNAVSYVDRNLHRKIRIDDLAALCGMSRYRFTRMFKRRFGMTFQDFVVDRRMREAKRLLENPNASISDVCWSVGFTDISYFSRMFRRHFGVSPSEFRRNDNGASIHHSVG